VVTTGADVVLAALDPARTRELVWLWRTSFEAGVGIVDPHPIEAQEQYFLREVQARHEVRVALRGDALVGFVAADAESVVQLHVRVGCWRRGIGTRLLDWAKSQSGGSLWLYTFARNARARAFYERNGFEAVAYGFEPTWRLADLRYRWVAGPAPALAGGAA
jgi:ribosomal protein S18 acetylase RimI-like enzyme